MVKPLLLFIGKSASGKTSVANQLNGIFGLKVLQSYTTRPQRYLNEPGHMFISEAEFDALSDKVAYTEYNGFKYCATKEQVDNSDIYIIDPSGLESLLNAYDTGRPLKIFYFNVDICTRIDRMIHRMDTDAAIISRLYTDEAFDWEQKIDSIIKSHSPNNIQFYRLNANVDKESVLNQIIQVLVKGGEYDADCM